MKKRRRESDAIERGLVRKDDVPKAEESDLGSANDNAPGRRPGLSPRLLQDLTAHKSAALGAELVRNPDVALGAVVHCIALKSLYGSYTTGSCLKISLHGPRLKSLLVADCRRWRRLAIASVNACPVTRRISGPGASSAPAMS